MPENGHFRAQKKTVFDPSFWLHERNSSLSYVGSRGAENLALNIDMFPKIIYTMNIIKDMAGGGQMSRFAKTLFSLLLLFLLFLLVLFLHSAQDIILESKVTYAGQIGLHNNDQETRTIDDSSFINTAYIELYYDDHDLWAVQQDTSYHEQVNHDYISGFDLSYFDTISVSAYSPHFIIVDGGDAEDFMEKVIALSHNEAIASIYVYEEYLLLTERDPIQGCTHDDGADCGGSGGSNYYGTFEGLGEVAQTNGNVMLDTRIGIVERYAPYFADSQLSDMNWKIQSPYYSLTDIHATNVVKTLKNEYAETSDYAVFVSCALYPYEIMNSVNWLINEGVSIINISMGIDTETTYNSTARYFDYVSVQNNVLFVMANTNIPNTENTLHVTFPGLSYNVLTVGAVNQNLLYENKSGYKVAFQISKPNLVDNCKRPYSDGCATSYSTPRVTAKAARLINTYPELKNNLVLLLSVIHTGSSIGYVGGVSPDYDATGFEKKVGAGFLNSSNAHLIMDQNQHAVLQFSTYPDGMVFYEGLINVVQGGYIYLSVATPAIVSKSRLYYLFHGYAPIQLQVRVNGSPVGTYDNGNILYARFFAISGSVVEYRVFIVGAAPNQEYDVALSWR
ncbi:MAG: hypothetical protein EA375_02140 [Acholeplasmataceae bacterium]|nr:MAG: hypothetical protein EA375_02140 [Acholeplasmataceae bacterium]